MLRFLQISILLLLGILLSMPSTAQPHSVAREWNEVLLASIRKDFARPTVHARNLFHTSIAMYDAWAAYEPPNKTVFLGNTLGEYSCPFEGIPASANKEGDQETAISYAMYRILKHRFKNSPNATIVAEEIDAKFSALNYDSNFVSTDYSGGSAAALGNYIAEHIIAFGLQDGSNEYEDYRNIYYFPQNFSLNPNLAGAGFVFAPDNWQPLSFDVFRDQSGNEIPGGALEFLSPEWGNVVPFALTDAEKTTFRRDGFDFNIYMDPGPPPLIRDAATRPYYQEGFSMVPIWSSHLDPADPTIWDISPASIGNIATDQFPTTYEDYGNFYKKIEGGDPSIGHTMNPVTGAPYVPQNVLRADYTRVLAEFWADGPDSETPPGHWFCILNYVNDHPEFVKKFKGEGPVLNDLEWDVKAYLSLGGAVHDAAIASWSIKGWYDYIRPISAVRYMADKGQSSDPNQASYDQLGIPLEPGYIEVISEGDPLAGDNNVNVGKIKLYTWRGPNYINDPKVDYAGVDWILAEEWWPYQRPTFVTPPFAGFISGHSTFSRAAAEVLTLLTGDAFFPGGMGEFVAKKNEFLRHEEGPTQDITLQWATYRDASDQTSLSRIWGGIHPPADDIPGRIIGEKIGIEAFNYAETFFDNPTTSITNLATTKNVNVYPNPVSQGDLLTLDLHRSNSDLHLNIYNIQGQLVQQQSIGADILQSTINIGTKNLSNGFYVVELIGAEWAEAFKINIAK